MQPHPSDNGRMITLTHGSFMSIDPAHAVARRGVNSQNEGHGHDARAEAFPMFLDIVLLRTFVAIVEAKGFTRAAGCVDLTQSAVSLH